MNFTKHVLKDFAKLCNIAYLSNDEVHENFISRPFNLEEHSSVFYNCDDEPKLYSRERDSQMYVCHYNGMLSITFRGTESARDIITDLNIIQVKMPIKYMMEKDQPEVHWGFYNQFKELKPDIDKIIEEYRESDHNFNKEVVFSGHSLGGALATISALHYGMKYPDLHVNCVTFGSPRVGDERFANYFDKIVKNSYRFVNDNDPIPCIPTAWRYQHVKGCIWLHQDQVKNEITVWRGWRFFKNYMLSFLGLGYDASQDHSCDGYCEDLKYLENDLSEN